MMNNYVIPFAGLKIGKHQFQYQIDKAFFEDYPYEEILDADLSVELDFFKQNTLLELAFKLSGTIMVTCDSSSKNYHHSISATLDLVVKFGEKFNDENIEILVIPHERYELNVAQYIFEMIVLAVPVKKEHPGIKDGTLKSDIIDKLKELQPKEYINTMSSDPRWDKLKELLTDNNHNNGTSKEKNIQNKKR